MMNSAITSSSLLLASSLTLLFLMWKTNSLRVSISTTTTVSAIGATSVLHIFELYAMAFFILIVVMYVLVWRIIPYDKIDSWHKKH